ncbi:unnamed protein product [Rhizophagus irregularis]|nr:unnamed protein product [Rhizophagus irregularis]CAB5206805.1 unnamed protein product [Rhizophagus irregularis]CAB5210220.1 unnamed protein product [Rhizophagus irregularis]
MRLPPYERIGPLINRSILFCIHRCAWIPEKIKRGFKKQERILFKIAIQSSSFGCIRDEDYHIDGLGRVQRIVSSWNPHNGYSLITASLRSQINQSVSLEHMTDFYKNYRVRDQIQVS